MMDLREYLKVLEEEHELQKIKAEVDPKHKRASRAGSKVHGIKGSRFGAGICRLD